MEPIFDQAGQFAGWFNNGLIFDPSARVRAFVYGDSVFGYNQHYLGRLDDGFFRDRNGNVVGFLQGAQRGPVVPVTQVAPVPPLVPPPPPPPPLPPPPPHATPTNSWSPLTFAQFVTA